MQVLFAPIILPALKNHRSRGNRPPSSKETVGHGQRVCLHLFFGFHRTCNHGNIKRMHAEVKFFGGKPGQKKGLACWMALGFLSIAAVLIFAGLGHYPLWEDEALTALGAKGVLRTLDTSALVDDHNVLAFRGGFELENLRRRYAPPLQDYLTAPFLAVFGEQNALAARLPFALCGLAIFTLIFWWLWRGNASVAFALLLCLGLVCNVSLILYSKQCRYYSVGTLCCVAVAFLYLNWKGQPGRLFAISLISFCLLASSYLYYAAFYVCLAADYAIWGRRENRLGPRDWLLLLLPQFVLGAVVVWIWNPLGRHDIFPETMPWLAAKLTLFWWNWRDLNRCEYGSLLLLAAAPLLYWRSRHRWLIRAPLALFIFVSVVTLCSPQPIGCTREAAVRFLVPVIPLCVAIEALALCVIARERTGVAILLGVLVFGTNLCNGGPLLWCGFRSTITSYLAEIINPPGDPYTESAQWINEHLREKESIWVLPDYACYPLMFHAPKAIYAWQLAGPPAGQFAGLPRIHFGSEVLPDYVIIFGPQVGKATPAAYELIHTINHYWNPSYRPELIWRTFVEQRIFSPNDSRLIGNAIYVFRRRAAGNSGPSNEKLRKFN
jgi:hypothetical protein